MIAEPCQPASFAGHFYPKEGQKLTETLHSCFTEAEKTQYAGIPQALIVPHAGYIYSGMVAATAYRRISPSAYKNIFLLGSSHRYCFDEMALPAYDCIRVPNGQLHLNTKIRSDLLKDSLVRIHEQAHTEEHSLEVQLPFLLYKGCAVPPLIPLLLGTREEALISSFADVLKPYFTKENLFIISTDFSHYPAYENACIIDQQTAALILESRPNAFTEEVELLERRNAGLATALCGRNAVLCLLYLMEENKKLKIEHLIYRNSGDTAYGEKQRVVGYHAFSII